MKSYYQIHTGHSQYQTLRIAIDMSFDLASRLIPSFSTKFSQHVQVDPERRNALGIYAIGKRRGGLGGLDKIGHKEAASVGAILWEL